MSLGGWEDGVGVVLGVGPVKLLDDEALPGLWGPAERVRGVGWGVGGVPAAAITTAHRGASSARTPLSHDFALALPFPLPHSHALPPAL